MGKQTEYVVVVADRINKRWPHASKLVAAGVPLAVARRYQIVRRQMTSGLRKRVGKDAN